MKFETSRALTVDELMRRARKEVGLNDFGDLWFLEPLTKLVDLINTEANLVSTDIDMVDRIVACLVDRLRLVTFLDEHPGVLDEEVDVRGVIIGLARGGSTLAQRLIGSSPQLTSVQKYELYTPLPLPGEALRDSKPRIAHAQRNLDEMAARWPEMASMHPMTATDYEEEIELIDRSFACTMYSFYFHLPAYSDWLFDYDDIKAYEELLLWLKVLQYRSEPKRPRKWILKSPHHLMSGSLRNCIETFPSAKILMTHRNLRSVVGSCCNLQYSMFKDVTRDLDPAVIGPESIQLHRRALERMIEIRSELPADRFIDLQYSRLVSDPIGEFEHALTRMGFSMTDEDEDAAREWMASNRRETHPPHRYKLEDYGVDLRQFDRIFEFYHDGFVAE
jgi:hypothetical protein